jgi:lactoylglutathione lyase
MYELAHIALVVRDCEKSAQFYSDVLDFSIRKKVTTNLFKVIFLKTDTLVIELLEYLSPEPKLCGSGVYDHLAFRVPDLPTIIAGLQSQGIKFETAQPRQAFDGRQIIFISGPDGERIELVGA